jgi:uncharacterized alpha-E superfamily protein
MPTSPCSSTNWPATRPPGRKPARRAPPACPTAQRRLKDIFQGGLHEFLTAFIAENNRIGAIIADQYLV